jgi:ABC-type transporter Mla subunit MlaD
MIVALVLSVFSLIAIGAWFDTLADSFAVTSDAVEAVDSTITVVDDALEVLDETLTGVDGVFESTDRTLSEVSAVVLSSGTLLQDEIPGQIDALQSAMEGLIGTANVVDGVLSAISIISFVGVDYDPAVPLDDALADVNQRLGDVGDSLSGYSADLFSVAVSLNRLGEDLGGVGDSLGSLRSQVGESRQLISQYQEAAGSARELIDDAVGRLSGQAWLVRVLAVLLFLSLIPVFGLMWWIGRGLRAEQIA